MLSIPSTTRPQRAGTVNIQKRQPKRIVLIGSTKCGKTSLIKRYLNNTFDEEYQPTIEECYNHQCTYKGVVWNLDIIDSCGPFMFPVMRDFNIKGAHILLLVYEIGKENSIQEIVRVWDQVRQVRPSGVPVVVVGTKMDLNSNIRRASTTNLLLKLDDDTRHVLTSAKNNVGVTDVFEFSLDDFIKRDPKYLVEWDDEEGEDTSWDMKRKRWICCCRIL